MIASAWRAAHSFADPVRDARREHHRPRPRECDEKLAERRHAVTGGNQRSSVPQIGESTRDGLHGGRRAVGETLDQTEHRRWCTEHAGYEERQDRIQHLGCRVLKERHRRHDIDVAVQPLALGVLIADRVHRQSLGFGFGFGFGIVRSHEMRSLPARLRYRAG